MAENKIHLIITPQQAKGIAIALKLAKEILAQPPGTTLHPNLGDFELERDLMKAEINATQETVLEQMEGQMPEE
jgi:hypothetical protein